ncbi:hypothetical protein ELI55_27125 (plasmid) [Rhizobium ruizarguesonis]|nr:hypothetical protein ELI55_27125 [Rhizobium ruizarguesonis]TAZ26547.1 hypothetical protein ELH74_31365 [Rhizobium ruizarguesonis]
MSHPATYAGYLAITPTAACCEGDFGVGACGTGRSARCLFGNQNIENQRFFATPSFAIFVSSEE